LFAQENWSDFDSEMFAQLVNELLEILTPLSRLANEVAVELREPLLYRSDPVVAFPERSAPPALIEVWDCIPGPMRAEVEKNMRGWRPPARGQARAFFDRLKALLRRHWPKLRPGRYPSLISAYRDRVAMIWRQLKLKVGEARGEAGGKRAEGLFQQFANQGLRAVGDDSMITI